MLVYSFSDCKPRECHNCPAQTSMAHLCADGLNLGGVLETDQTTYRRRETALTMIFTPCILMRAIVVLAVCVATSWFSPAVESHLWNLTEIRNCGSAVANSGTCIHFLLVQGEYCRSAMCTLHMQSGWNATLTFPGCSQYTTQSTAWQTTRRGAYESISL